MISYYVTLLLQMEGWGKKKVPPGGGHFQSRQTLASEVEQFLGRR